jgi:uncharacterized protein YgbK (DUF1537 family)
MRDHPLTPMTESNLVQVLRAQCTVPIGLGRYDTVMAGSGAIERRFDALRADGVRIAVVDAIDNDDLRAIGTACAAHALVTAGSGVALGLAPAYAALGWLAPDLAAADIAPVGGSAALLSGSSSQATNAQVATWIADGGAAFRIDPFALARGEPVATIACEWAARRLAGAAVLIYATALPAEVRAAQAALGAQAVGQLVEQCIAEIACRLVDGGVRRLVVAGGETSGTVVQSLKIDRLRVGPTIDPGVPWMKVEDRPLLLALKSGNFGGADFFGKALAMVR